MPTNLLLVTASVLAAVLSPPSLAGEGDHGPKPARKNTKNTPAAPGFDQGMKAVPHTSGPEAPGHGWRYFSDPATRRAVVISPQGDYYYSRGNGLRWIAAELS